MIADPDYARIFTQARIIAWQYGFALLQHGNATRDLDLLLVPWEERAASKPIKGLVRHIAEMTGTTIKGEPVDKPHGRTAWTLMLPDAVRWVDLSVMPAVRKAKEQAR